MQIDDVVMPSLNRWVILVTVSSLSPLLWRRHKTNVCVRDLALALVTHQWLRQGANGIRGSSVCSSPSEERPSLEAVSQLSHTHLLFRQRDNSCGSTFQIHRPSLPPSPSLPVFFPPSAQQIQHNIVTRLLEPGINGSDSPCILLYSSSWPQAKFPTDYQHLHCSVACHSREATALESFLNPLCCLKDHRKAMKC